MNVFILNSGRCGSTTFIRACQHISNYTARHESRSRCTGLQRLDYPDNHIEADNRLSWILGRLDRKYGNNAFYVHLSRNFEDTAESFLRRMEYGIMRAYREGILLGGADQSAQDIAFDYLLTVQSNIELFLNNKVHQMDFRLETAVTDFRHFWRQIGAEGDLDKALNEWDTPRNASA